MVSQWILIGNVSNMKKKEEFNVNMKAYYITFISESQLKITDSISLY